MKERTRIVTIAVGGVLFSIAAAGVMLYAGLTHQSASEVVVGAFGSLRQGSAGHTTYSPPEVAFDIPITLSLLTAGGGDTSTVMTTDGLAVSLTAIEDSRCPIGKTCLAAGERKAVLRLSGPADAQARDVRIGEVTSRIGTNGVYIFELKNITSDTATFIIRVRGKG